MKNLISGIICCIVLSAGCSDAPSGPSAAGQIIPLEVGNYWIYSYRKFDSAGGISYSMEWTEAVDSDTVIDGERLYSIRDIVSMFIGFKQYYVNRSDGVYCYSPGSEPLSLYIKYPVQQNELIVRRYDTLRVINAMQKTETPAGWFYCVVYQSVHTLSTGPVYETTYYCPGIGKVKVETGIIGESGEWIPNDDLRLTEYKVGGTMSQIRLEWNSSAGGGQPREQ